MAKNGGKTRKHGYVATELFCRFEVLETCDKLCAATDAVAFEGHPLAVDDMVRRPGRNRTVRMTCDGATTDVAYARHRHAMNFEVGGTTADNLASV
jgi:hypothetical protein